MERLCCAVTEPVGSRTRVTGTLSPQFQYRPRAAIFASSVYQCELAKGQYL